MNDEISGIIEPNVNDNAPPELGEVVEKIDKSKLENVTNPDCQHLRTKRTPADEEFGAPVDEIACLDCPIGWHVARSTETNTRA